MSVMSSDDLRAGVPGRETADLLIDSARLSELVGRPVRATRLRHKPGLSTRAVLFDAASDCPPGWVQVTYREHVDKLRNARRRAGERGQHIELREVPSSLAGGDLLLAFGEIDTDPRLQRGLDIVRETYPSVHDALALRRLSVLRYNPQRRLVLRSGAPAGQPQVLRVTADKQRDIHRRLAVLAEAGVPVLQPLADRNARRSRRVTRWPWYGTSDLQNASPEDAHRYAAAAGRALAALHAVHVHDARLDPVSDPALELTALVADLRRIDADAAERMRLLVTQVSTRLSSQAWESGAVHGDFSADQVLVAGPVGSSEEGLVLSDFDRIGVGPLPMDLGTFAAAELLARGTASVVGSGVGRDALNDLPLTSAVATGYAQARPGSGSAAEPAWVARALLARASEPFRDGVPEWRELVHDRLDQVQEVLS